MPSARRRTGPNGEGLTPKAPRKQKNCRKSGRLRKILNGKPSCLAPVTDLHVFGVIGFSLPLRHRSVLKLSRAIQLIRNEQGRWPSSVSCAINSKRCASIVSQDNAYGSRVFSSIIQQVRQSY